MIEFTPPGLIAGFVCLFFLLCVCAIPAIEIAMVRLLGSLKHLFWGDNDK